MKSSPHFGVKCPRCKSMAAVPMSPSLVDEDPTKILRSLPAKDQQEIVDFYIEHESHGEGIEPCVVDIDEIARA